MYCIIKPVIDEGSYEKTIMFAAEELKKYLEKVSDKEFLVVPTDKYEKKQENIIYIGLNLSNEIKSVENIALDDAIYIDIENSTGIITGNNPHSVLIAAYRFLREKGFCFVRPGENGERYPNGIDDGRVYVSESASYRHRAICIEGAVFQNYLTDIIDWLPKVAMNGYFIQFQLPRVFFDNWYQAETPYRDKIKLTDDEIRAIVAMAEGEIEKRDLLYHGVGHGWTTQAFGIEGSSWAEYDEPEEQYKEVLALVNGERKLWKKVPLNTNLCYSKKKARERVTDNIVSYCKKHSNIDYLHFWLADDSNNNCECEECKKLRTSDYYVKMLNELDEKLEKEGMKTKIVFLIYNDLLWRPLSEKIKNRDRFVIMFAPITRSFYSSFKESKNGEMKPYELNKLEFPKNVNDNIAYLSEWQKEFDGDGFDYDYHYVWEHYFELPQYMLSKILSEDIKALGNLKLNGLVSCQVQRAFFPTSLGMIVMAHTLWNKETEFKTIADNTLKAEFGEEYLRIEEYLCKLSGLGCAKALHGEEELVTEENRKSLAEAIKAIETFRPVIAEQKEKNEHSKIIKSWEKLEFFSELYLLMLKMYIELAKGNPADEDSHIRELVLKNENRFKEEFDVISFLATFEKFIIKIK